MTRTYYAVYGQTIFDIALMTYGTLDELPKLMADNSFPGVNEYPTVGQAFTYDDTLVFNQTVSVQNFNKGVNYSTRSDSTGSQYYQVEELGLPIGINQGGDIIPIPPPLPQNNSIIVVEHGDSRLSLLGGLQVYTANSLLGKSNFLVASTQIGAFFNPENIFYNPSLGSIIINEDGFILQPGDQLLLFLNISDLDLPSLPDLFTTVAGANDSRISIVGGQVVFTDPAIIGLNNVRVSSRSLGGFFFRSEDFVFDNVLGTVTMYPGFTMSPTDQLIVYKNILNPDA